MSVGVSVAVAVIHPVEHCVPYRSTVPLGGTRCYFWWMTVDSETGTRGRTRKAILDAAIRVLAADPSASLGQIADAADVGRTTLHRYFPDRAELLAAVMQEAGRRLGRRRRTRTPGRGHRASTPSCAPARRSSSWATC